MKGYTTLVLEGLARMLQDNNLGEWDPDPDVPYAGTLPAIVLKELPPTPHAVIALAFYTPLDDPRLAMGTMSVQVRARGGPGDPMACDDMLDPVFDLLHGASYVPLVPGQPAISSIIRKSSLPMGADSNRRWERADNYMLFGSRPTLHRPIQ